MCVVYMFCVASVVCGCVLYAQCMFCVPCAFARVHVLCFCVCSVYVEGWFRAVCGPSQCSAPWGCQWGPREASAPERSQMGSEACG